MSANSLAVPGESAGAPEAPDEPAQAPALDLAHLARQTDGDNVLADELLRLFKAQAVEIAARIEGLESPALLAHRLKGAAQAVGAWTVAEAAERVECGAGTSGALQAAVAATLPAVEACLADRP